jgi:predicted peptidase
MNYLLSVPKAPGPHPLLCFLHGYDEGAPAPIESAVPRHGPLRPGNPSFVTDTFAIVAPQLPKQGDFWVRYREELREIVAEVVANEDIDERRRYLTGFSFGGNGVFDIAIAEPAEWCALWVVDPTRVPIVRIDLPLWLSVGEVARYARTRFISTLELEPYAENEGSDRVFVDEGRDHVASAMSAYRDLRIYRWLLQHVSG